MASKNTPKVAFILPFFSPQTTFIFIAGALSSKHLHIFIYILHIFLHRGNSKILSQPVYTFNSLVSITYAI